MPAKQPESLRETVKLMYLQGVKLPVIMNETGVKHGTIRTWANRYGWNATVATATGIMVRRGTNALLRESSAQLATTSDKLKALLSGELEKAATVLVNEPVTKAGQLANTPQRQGRVAVLKGIAEAASIVHDWKSSSNPGLVLCDLLNSEREQPGSTIEIAAETQALPCGIDATTSSVPDPQPGEPIPQDEESPSPLSDHPPAD